MVRRLYDIATNEIEVEDNLLAELRKVAAG